MPNAKTEKTMPQSNQSRWTKWAEVAFFTAYLAYLGLCAYSSIELDREVPVSYCLLAQLYERALFRAMFTESVCGIRHRYWHSIGRYGSRINNWPRDGTNRGLHARLFQRRSSISFGCNRRNCQDRLLQLRRARVQGNAFSRHGRNATNVPGPDE